MQELNNGQVNETEQKNNIDLSDLDAKIASLQERLEACKPEPSRINTVSIGTKTQMLVSMIFVIISMSVLALSSYAWFTASTASNTNIMQSGSAGVEFVDLSLPDGEGGSEGTELDPIGILPGYVVERKVYAKNVGGVSLYVRAKVETDIELDERYAAHESDINTALIAFDFNDEKWEKVGDYYYLKSSLRGGSTSDEFFSNIIFSEQMGNIYKDSTIRVTVYFEVVQANNNGSSPLEAVGWKTAVEGGDGQ